MRLKRRGLSPAKISMVYVIALFLVAWHQAGQLAGWFNNVALSHEGAISEAAFSAAIFLEEDIAPYGPNQLNQGEDWVVDFFASFLNEKKVEAPASPVTQQANEESQEAATTPTSDYLEALNPRAPKVPSDTLIIKPPLRDPVVVASPPSEEGLSQLPVEPVKTPETSAKLVSNILLLGDSMMLEGLGPPLQRELKKIPGLTVKRHGRYGTGLARLDTFDWLSYFGQMLDTYNPGLVIITLGANDTQDIVIDGRRLHVGQKSWNEVYAQRVAALLQIASERNVIVIWVGLPIMGQEPYGSRAANINKQTQMVCDRTAGCRFWDAWLSVADEKGKYSVYLPDGQGKTIRARSKDAIHLTESGGRIMATQFLDDLKKWVDFTPKAPSKDKVKNETTNNNGAKPQPKASLSIAPSAGEGDTESSVVGLEKINFFSEIRQKNTPLILVRPSAEANDGSSGGPWPVVFMLHGAWDGPQTWVNNMGADALVELANEFNILLVLPDGEPFGWYLDGQETKIESFLVDELLPAILSRPEADKTRVGILGLSMGGHGALSLALKHPSIFKAAGSMSGVLDLTAHAGGGKNRSLDAQLGLDKVLGPAGAQGERWKASSVRGLTESLGQTEGWGQRPLIISVGLEDHLTLAENKAYHQLLLKQNQEHIYIEEIGGHSWDFWSAQVPIHLEFISKKLRELP